MSRPWSIRRREQDRAPVGEGGVGELADALRSRTNALQAAAAKAATGIRRDYEAFSAGGAIPEAAGAGELVDSLARRIEKISTECGEVATLLERYAAFALAVESEPAQETDEADADDAHRSDEAERHPAGVDRADEKAPAAAAAPLAAVEAVSAVEPDRVKSPVSEAVPPDRAVEISAGIRLLATQMSVAGSDRDEIERRLREDFGVANATEVVAGIFGV